MVGMNGSCIIYRLRRILIAIVNHKVCVYNVYIMNSKEIIKLLEKDGWKLRDVKGSHHIYIHPERGGHISVPHPKKDLGIGLVKKLLKQARIKE